MKENEKRVSILVQEGDQNKSSNLHDDKKSNWEKLKKPMIFVLMGAVFLGSMYLIFKPTSDKKETENMGLNDVVPQASEAGLQKDKQKAYEQEILDQKDQEKRKALTTLSDYWNEKPYSNHKEDTLSNNEAEDNNSYADNQVRSGNSGLYNYRNAQSTLGSFYKDDNAQTNELRKQLDELKAQLAEKEVPKAITVNDQLSLMEKSYQMAAKYLPSRPTSGEIASTKNTAPAASFSKQEAYFTAFKPVRKNTVSTLSREPTDSAFLADWNENKNRGFYTAGSVEQVAQPKNSIKASVQETQTIIGESGVRLRLLEPAQTPNSTIPQGTIITANAKFQAGRLQLKVTSIELDGNIIPVDITIYDLDGQQGLYVPYSPEVNALTEMAGNMSQTSGTSLMLTQSAGQQMAADLSRGVVQGISGYFSKKVKTPKVTLKAGHQVFLVSKK